MKRKNVTSSGIASVGYDAANLVLEVEFQHGGIYQYLRVPNWRYRALMHAKSIGNYFVRHIRNAFAMRKVS
jgi:hypothetical protein